MKMWFTPNLLMHLPLFATAVIVVSSSASSGSLSSSDRPSRVLSGADETNPPTHLDREGGTALEAPLSFVMPHMPLLVDHDQPGIIPRSHIGARPHAELTPLEEERYLTGGDSSSPVILTRSHSHDWVYSQLPFTSSNRRDQEMTWPRACMKGRSQSPIDIKSALAVVASQLDGAIQPNLTVVPTLMRNSGHGFQLHYTKPTAEVMVTTEEEEESTTAILEHDVVVNATSRNTSLAQLAPLEAEDHGGLLQGSLEEGATRFFKGQTTFRGQRYNFYQVLRIS